MDGEAEKHREQLRRLLDPLRQLVSTVIDTLNLRVAIALGSSKYLPKGGRQCQLTFEPVRVFGHPSKQIETPGQMTGGFGICRPLIRALAGAMPEQDRLRQLSGFREMVRQEFRLGGHDIRRPLFQNLGNAAMKLPAAALKERLIGSIADERMLEAVSRFRKASTANNQCSADQPIERPLQLRLVEGGQRRNQ